MSPTTRVAARGLPTWGRRRYARAWRARVSLPGEITYVALGDSAAQGLGASRPERGYVGLLADLGAARTGRTLRVVNLSVSGATIRDVVTGQLPLLAGLAADVVTCAVGGNDVRRFRAEAFADDIRDLVAGLPAHALVADVPCFYGGRWEVRAREAAALAREAIGRAGLVRVDLHATMERRTRDEVRGDFALDMFHPNDRGYAVWADAFAPAFLARLDAVVRARGAGQSDGR